MPPKLLFDLSEIDLTGDLLFTKDQILEVNPQNYEMQQLDGILWYNTDDRLVLGYKDVTDDEFWIRGHIPGRPLMPGVIMVEAAAQLLSFYVRRLFGVDGFIGFAGIESAKFRASVAPGSRLYLLGHITSIKSRKFSAHIQGICDGTFIFETYVSGMKV